MKIYESREELMVDIAKGGMGKNLQQVMRDYEAGQARKGLPVSFGSFVNALKTWGME